MADYYTLLTNAGIAYETACKAAGTPIKLTQISVGDGGGAVYNPAATATALKREVWRGPLNALFQDEKNPSWLLAEVTIPPDVGGWYVREAGLWTDTGVLYAIVKYPESFKPVLATSGSGKEFYIRSIFETSNASLVTLLIDDTVVKATRAWVMSYLAEELGKLDGKQSVRVAASTNIVLNGAQQIDGVAVIAGDRVLLTNQTLAKDNGLWIVANGDWVRATDANTSAKVTPGLTVMVEEGTANGDSLWHLTTNAPITLGTTALTFKMLAGRTGIAAGTYKSLTVDEYGRATAGANPETLAGFGIKDSYTKAEVEALIAKASALPVGSIVAFPVDTPPPGFLELDNSVKSSATYPDLSAYLGGKFNKGDEGVGNFRLPEARGEFLRGWDHGRGVDGGRPIGSWQKGSLQSFDPSNVNPAVSGLWHNMASDAGLQDAHGLDPHNTTDYSVSNAVFTAGATPVSTGALGVTRPRNLAVMWCIKAWNAAVNQGSIDVAALAVEVRNSSGRYLRTRIFKANDLYQSGPDTKKIKYRLQGGGGAGGGAASTANTQLSAGCGGSAGAYAEGWLTQGFDGQQITIGKGGVGVVVNVGLNGGTTSFAGIAAPGGYGGGFSLNGVPPLQLGRSPNSELASGGSTLNANGQGGGGVSGPTLALCTSGEGGPSKFGPGGNASGGASREGEGAVNPGAGGGGALAKPSCPYNFKGGNGADGILIIE
ncbi:phage tail protein, partial [Pseudomonas sp. HMWF006]|uniref:phage tail-collar fiber domain-containing protein n=1 Tax=Pseudomonas sp. HMWF006 TaxID=2056843 RepID=UPI002113AA5C